MCVFIEKCENWFSNFKTDNALIYKYNWCEPNNLSLLPRLYLFHWISHSICQCAWSLDSLTLHQEKVWSSAFILTLLKSVENGSGLEIFFGFLTLYWLMFCLSWFTSNTRDYTRAEELGFWIQHKVMFNWVLSDYSVKLS